jgi:hypothetical protein
MYTSTESVDILIKIIPVLKPDCIHILVKLLNNLKNLTVNFQS